MSVPNQEGEWSYICVLGVDFASFYNIFIRLCNCSDSVVCLGFFFFLLLMSLYLKTYQRSFIFNACMHNYKYFEINWTKTYLCFVVFFHFMLRWYVCILSGEKIITIWKLNIIVSFCFIENIFSGTYSILMETVDGNTKSMKYQRGNQNPYFEEGQIIQW